MKIEPGILIKTNYSGPYRVQKIVRGCTCPVYTGFLEDEKGQSVPHMHIVCTEPDGKGKYYLNHFIEETLLSIQKSYCGQKEVLDYDEIVIMGHDRLRQGSLFSLIDAMEKA